MSNMFDVILPLYKVKPKYLKQCLKSISYSVQKKHFDGDYNIIIIDKTPLDWEHYDECLNLIVSYGEMKYYRQEGFGVSDARNVACSIGNNPYICFIDGDDFWYDSHLYEVSQEIKKSDSDIVMWWTAMDLHCESAYDSTKTNHFVINHEEKFKDWISGFHYYYLTKTPICTSTVCLKRERFEETSGFLKDYAIGEDMEMWTRMVGKPKNDSNVYNSHQIPVITGYKNIHEDNTTEGGTQSYLIETSNRKEYLEEQLENIMKLYEIPTMADKPSNIDELDWQEMIDSNRIVL